LYKGISDTYSRGAPSALSLSWIGCAASPANEQIEWSEVRTNIASDASNITQPSPTVIKKAANNNQLSRFSWNEEVVLEVRQRKERTIR